MTTSPDLNGDPDEISGQHPNPLPPPQVSAVSPERAPTTGGDVVTLTGKDLVAGASVRFGGQLAERVTWMSSTAITAVVPQHEGLVGPVRIQVVNPDGQSAGIDQHFSYYPGSVSFYKLQPFQGGYGPNSVLLRDLNGDGVSDIVAAYTTRGVEDPKNSVSVFLGHGGGAFTFSKDYEAGNGLFAMAIDDIDGDHKLDIVVSNATDNTISVYKGQGDGTFKDRVNYPTSNDAMADDHPVSLVLTDVNGDGWLDVVTANLNSTSLSVFLGNKLGGFEPARQQKLTFAPWAMAADRIDRDDTKDLAVTVFRGKQVVVLAGKGDGTFTESPDPTPLPDVAYGIAIADLDKDKHMDLLITSNTGNTLTVLLGRGNGGFDFSSSPYVGQGPKNPVVEDINGDKVPDVIIPCFDGKQVSVLLGRSDKALFSQAMSYSTDQGPYVVATGDMDGDGLPDLLAGNSGGTFNVLINSSK